MFLKSAVNGCRLSSRRFNETASTNKQGYMIMSNLFARFLKDESGATAIEYGLIAALISVGIIAGVRSLGSSLSSTFNTLGTTMTDAAN